MQREKSKVYNSQGAARNGISERTVVFHIHSPTPALSCSSLPVKVFNEINDDVKYKHEGNSEFQLG
jgi:hypothetical protein